MVLGRAGLELVPLPKYIVPTVHHRTRGTNFFRCLLSSCPMREELALTEASKLRFGPEIVEDPSPVRGRSSDECGRSAERISSSAAADSIMSSVRQCAATQR